MDGLVNDKTRIGGSEDIIHTDAEKKISRRLALGTAQLGMPYGIANRNGRPSEETATGIIEKAWQEGIHLFDTAGSYGESESVLGRCFQRIGTGLDPMIITKLDPDLDEAGPVLESIYRSLKRLKQPSLWALLLHREEMLDSWDELWLPVFNEARELGLVLSFGVSVYSPERALQALECKDLDLIQLPANVFDRRMSRSGIFNRARDKGIKILIRSVFLQGLALMEPFELSGKMRFAKTALDTLDSFCLARDLDKQSFLLHYLLLRYPEAVILFGAETVEQVKHNCRIAKQDLVSEEICDQWDQVWPLDDEQLVNPTRW